MSSLFRFALFAALLYASYSSGMQSSNPHTELDPAGRSAASLLTTLNHVSGHVLGCRISGVKCDVRKCLQAGGQCAPSSTGKNCIQRIQLDTSKVPGYYWKSFEQTQSACKNCSCRASNPESSSAPSLPTIQSSASWDNLRCQVRGTNICSSERCETAGGRCEPSPGTGTTCRQWVSRHGKLSLLSWSSFEPTLIACRGCLCLRGGSSLQESSSGRSMLRSPSTEHCVMYSKVGTYCNVELCGGAGGECVLEAFGHYTLEAPAIVPTICNPCRCKRKYKQRYALAGG
jgi:hypothetical protein